MSFVSLATLTMHRRNELESRINLFDEKCDSAINEIRKLKVKARSFISQLNCEPNELKERFLEYMKRIDEYMYLITDFNIAMKQIEESTDTNQDVSIQPVQDVPLTPIQAPIPNLLDALSEPRPSTSCCPSCPPEKPKKKKISKKEQTLIAFSSSSSSESIPNRFEVATKEVQCELTEGVNNMNLNDTDVDEIKLPAQTILELDHTYSATIMTVDGPFFWIIAGDFDEVRQLMEEMTEYYSKHLCETPLSEGELNSLVCRAYYDDQSDCYYRAYVLKQDCPESVQVFAVDTGEVRAAPAASVRPLAPHFAHRAPYARCCYLAGIDLDSCRDDRDKMLRLEALMRDFLGVLCTVQVEDNSSEDLGVYVILETGEVLNDIVLQTGLFNAIDKPAASPEVRAAVPPAPLSPLPLIPPMGQGPEYEDPVEAVTGYHNRDEADICKHYTGGPENTCFKGYHCKKKHVLKHPDGWTLDRVEVCGKVSPVPLPAPGEWRRVLVTSVSHFNRFHVQLKHEQHKEETPAFGVVLPPATLDRLIVDMNSPAARANYKPLKISPAVGEVVAAVYPPDGCWYRARVLALSRVDQNVQVMYIDFGTVLYVREDEVRALEARFAALPAQALPCALAGARAPSTHSERWLAATRALTDLALHKDMKIHVVARDYDEITVELYDEELGCNIAEQLAAMGHLKLSSYEVVDDSQVTCQLVVP